MSTRIVKTCPEDSQSEALTVTVDAGDVATIVYQVDGNRSASHLARVERWDGATIEGQIKADPTSGTAIADWTFTQSRSGDVLTISATAPTDDFVVGTLYRFDWQRTDGANAPETILGASTITAAQDVTR